MTVPIIPWWIRLFGDGNAKTTAIAAVCFALGVMVGKGDPRKGHDYWRDLASSYHNDNHGHHTQREHERDNHRKHYERS